MKKIILVAVIIHIFIAFLFLNNSKVLATPLDSVGIATYLSIDGDDGNIVTSTPKGYTLSKTPYDSQVIGVISKYPAISIRENKGQKGLPVINMGSVFVKVVGSGGAIKRGDFVTSSTVPGVGMKATENGFVIGEALENATFSKSSDIKSVLIRLNLHYLELNKGGSSFMDIFNISKIAVREKPNKALQYIIAALIIVASFAFGFFIFAKVVNTGIEALGRNPLAGRRIQLSIVFNLVLIIIVIITGVGLAYAMIRL